jgi:hypothetical protein
MHYLIATLSYTCSCGRRNELKRNFASRIKPVTHIDLMPYLPKEWPCATCYLGAPPYVEVSVDWLADDPADSTPFEVIEPTPSGKLAE